MHLIMTDSWPGYWGSGDTEDEALKNLRRAGGSASKYGTLRFVLNGEDYDDPQVDMMGGLTMRYKGDPETPHKDRPKMVLERWRVGPRGKRTRLEER